MREQVIASLYRFLNGELSEEKTFEPWSQQFSFPPTYIEAGVKAHLNTGNYESAEIWLGITAPCRLEDVQSTKDKMVVWLKSEINKEVKNAKGRID